MEGDHGRLPAGRALSACSGRRLQPLFLRRAAGLGADVENVIVGPLIAVLSFVCSVGNVPLAAVLWSGGISFAGVMAFIFADLIVLPIIAIYRKYYGWAFTLRITALMFVTMATAALLIDGVFSLSASCPTPAPPATTSSSVQLDYKLVLNVLALVVFAALFGLTMRRGATDPVCGMTVDREKAPVGSSTRHDVLLLLRALHAPVPGGGRTAAPRRNL